MGLPNEVGPREFPPEGPDTINASHRQATGSLHSKAQDHGSAAMSSQQVSWWSVHEHIAPILSSVEAWPMAGTPEWCALDDDDPAKRAALLDAAQHWVLRLETCQQAHCDASREISDAVDWSALAREALVHRAFYEHRPWLKRVMA